LLTILLTIFHSLSFLYSSIYDNEIWIWSSFKLIYRTIAGYEIRFQIDEFERNFRGQCQQFQPVFYRAPIPYHPCTHPRKYTDVLPTCASSLFWRKGGLTQRLPPTACPGDPL
jgi:hypothetical protein